MPRRTRRFLVGTAAVVVGASVQAFMGASAVAGMLQRLPINAADYWGGETRTPPFNPLASASRSLPRIARLIPPDARVLLVSGSTERIQYEFFFVPRSFALLQQFPPGLAERLLPVAPDLAWYANYREQQLQDRGQLWSPARFDTAVAGADFVVTFLPVQFEPTGPRFRLLARDEGSTLYAVQR